MKDFTSFEKLRDRWRKQMEAYADCEGYEGDNCGDHQNTGIFLAMKSDSEELDAVIRAEKAASLSPATISAQSLAQMFHESYERLAPNFGYETRKESAVPWSKVPENNRNLMIAVCDEILSQTRPNVVASSPPVEGNEARLDEAYWWFPHRHNHLIDAQSQGLRACTCIKCERIASLKGKSSSPPREKL